MKETLSARSRGSGSLSKQDQTKELLCMITLDLRNVAIGDIAHGHINHVQDAASRCNHCLKIVRSRMQGVANHIGNPWTQERCLPSMSGNSRMGVSDQQISSRTQDPSTFLQDLRQIGHMTKHQCADHQVKLS